MVAAWKGGIEAGESYPGRYGSVVFHAYFALDTETRSMQFLAGISEFHSVKQWWRRRPGSGQSNAANRPSYDKVT